VLFPDLGIVGGASLYYNFLVLFDFQIWGCVGGSSLYYNYLSCYFQIWVLWEVLACIIIFWCCLISRFGGVWGVLACIIII
jgi:hypothetical protein